MSTTAAEVEYQAILRTLLFLQGSNFATAAAIAWMVYDICLTIGEEVDFIWRAKFSIPKCLYIVARYSGLVNVIIYAVVWLNPSPSVKLCTFWLWFYALSANVFSVTFVNMVLVMRINALYGNRRTILIILVSFLTAEFSFEIFAAFYENHTTKSVAKPSFPPTLGCYSARKRVLLSVIAWSLNITISSAFYVMTVIQVMRSFNIRDWATFKQRLTFRGTTNMLEIFFRDGSIFYAMVFAAGLLNVLCFAIGGEIQDIDLPWVPATLSVAGSRLILNLRTSRVLGANDTLAAHSFYLDTFQAAPGDNAMSSDSPSYLSTIPTTEAESDYDCDCYALEDIHSL